ncbi:hypothetical protein EJ110_NYTH38522 [Nymphaea thermarum]|nr:hypothetical protein EJ110_NYTH38522 [Nymphaea thermarum]
MRLALRLSTAETCSLGPFQKRLRLLLHRAPVGTNSGRWRPRFLAVMGATPSSENLTGTRIAPAGFRQDFRRRPTEETTTKEPVNMEESIEKAIYRCRFLTFFAVLGSLAGSVLCFIKGCNYVVDSFIEYFSGGGKMVLMLVEAIDIYLVGTVMFVFGMGLYELFVSTFDVTRPQSISFTEENSFAGSNLLGMFRLMERPKWLEIHSINELKTKLGHVIVMILLVGLFEKSKKVMINSPLELLCFAASILVSSGSLLLLSRLNQSKHEKS